MGQSFDCGVATSSNTWCSVFLLKVGFTSSLSPLKGMSSKMPQPPTSWSCLFPFFLLALRASVLSLHHLIPDHIPLSPFSNSLPPSFPRSLPPSLPLSFPSLPPPLWLLSSPSQMRLQYLHFGPSACWPFRVLWTISCLGFLYFFFWLIIHLLVSTYHACSFGSDLPHSGWYPFVLSICMQSSWCPQF